MRGKSTIKFSFLFIALILGLNFTASAQEYPFKDSEKLAQAMLKAKIWGYTDNSKLVSEYIQGIPNNKQVSVWTYLGIYSSKTNDGWSFDKVVSASGQEVRDAFVIHQAYQLWSKGELKKHPAIEEILAQHLGISSKLLGDPANQAVKKDIMERVAPYWNKLSGYKEFKEKGYGKVLDNKSQINLVR